jgi:phosphonate transport system substrate-binding protein
MDILHFTTCQAPIAENFVQAVVEYVAQRLNISVQFVSDLPWPERMAQFDAGFIQVCWLCGVPYIWRADQPESQLELLAAPVPTAPRYQNRPVYFSEVVVRRDSAFSTWADLRGSHWAINERTSHSGYYVTRYHLALLAASEGFFGQVTESGAHQASLELILDGQIDASAIDSTVLDLWREQQPHLARHLRVIATLGPSPIPPWVINKNVAPEVRTALREALTHMHTQLRGQATLAQGQVARFVVVEDQNYDLIRHMVKVGERVTL